MSASVFYHQYNFPILFQYTLFQYFQEIARQAITLMILSYPLFDPIRSLFD